MKRLQTLNSNGLTIFGTLLAKGKFEFIRLTKTKN